ncbi:SusC/RagA family TonB-linked outer membrane protein [Parapedobacter pyrenivorans]|uniref:SusC/RagA family TonB-linked outer membrane protein n=2 Tax=Parapedobacter pyrenivorans TaxID=1305674 RepID=A0A917MAR4_9SPHI|nr:SusC/RagA family TonB-linked outer membrane protein [Parapedobacter pyrenivorans]
MQERTIKGRVSDANEAGIPGVSIKIKGTSMGTVTDLNGLFSIAVPDENAILEFSSVGYMMQEVPVKGRAEIRITLEMAAGDMEEVVITAFGTQKKESVSAAITTVKPSDLKIPSSNLTTALAGRVAGVIAYQRSGEPGLDNAEFYIRGVTSFSTAGKRDPLILIDRVEMTANDLARMNVDDIASFSVMKDASAAALYGARGANGVILVTTKEGTLDRLSISIRGEQSNSYNTKMLDLTDPITYMRLHNEAVRTRDPMVQLPYSSDKIRGTELGLDPIRYPAVNWYDYLIEDYATNRRINLNLTGGGQTVQYYLAANYQNDQGILKESKENQLDNNIDIDRLQVRSNVTIKFAPTTTGVVRAYGSFDDRTGPYIPSMRDEYDKLVTGGAAVFRQARNASQVSFLPFYPADEANQFTKHILFGRDTEMSMTNPWANLASSFQESRESMMQVQLEMEHRFIGKLEGFTAWGLYNAQRKGYYDHTRSYAPFYYSMANTIDGSYRLLPLNPDTGTEYLDYVGGGRRVEATQYGELRLTYNKVLGGKHDLSGALVGTIRNATGTINVDTEVADLLQIALPRRNISTAGRFAYGYDSRYYAEFAYGLNGTERFAEHSRWGFFPTVGASWVVSNEKFMSGLNDAISTLKLRGTYGEVGNDAIGSDVDRFFYLSQIDMNAGASYPFGVPGTINYSRSGITINRYANDLITWEIARKANVGVEVGLFNDFTLIADFFHERRRNILQTRQDIPTTMGIRGTPQANVGISEGRGIDAELKYNKTMPSGLWLSINGNFTYMSARFKQYEEPDYSDVPWRTRVGTKLSQPMGLIAERLFVDEEEVNNSPVQEFGEYMAGDIKYKDINNDGRINADDVVPIGYPTEPEIIYGTAFSIGYKAFDVSFFIQGSGRSSFFISPEALTPFTGRGQKALVQLIADDHWSETNRDIYAFWPRLSEYAIGNNNQQSTHWLRDGTFIRLKQAEVGYTLPEKLTKRARVNMLRVYLSGTNLLYWSTFKLWDPEMAGLGLGYPVQRVFNLGVNINF